MAQLPVGTVTFLFTDIESSTACLKDLGAERYSVVLERHNALLREEFAAHGGIEVENLGDGFFVAFPSAEGAVAAAAGVQRRLAGQSWPTRRPIAVRIGIHTGEALLGVAGYVGYAVHHAARIGDMGHGGQVLVSPAAATLAERNLPPGVGLRSLGEVAIADADRPERLRQLVIDGLWADFPPLRAKLRPALVPASERLLERAAEVAALTELVDVGSEGTGRFAVILGDAGIGKSTLVGEVRAASELRGMEVLFGRGGELEHEFSFGIVRQLFELRLALASPDERRELLSGSAALAERLFDDDVLAVAPSGPADTSFAVLHGLYWLIANLAARRPLLLVIDDLHWADEPSLRWLAYLVRRLEGLPVLVVAALRPPEQGFERTLLAELVSDPAAQLVCPKPLSRETVGTLVRSILSADAEPAFSTACHEATGGNPLLLRTLLDALASERVPPQAQSVGRVMEIGPEAVSRAVGLRLARLPPQAALVARAAAILGEDTELEVVADLAELEREVAADAASSLTRGGILRFDVELGFVHPVVRTALYGQLTPPERERAHARAARILCDHDAPAERIAAQLLLTPPTGQEFAISAFSAAAETSLRLGDPRGAAAYLRRALSEDPDDPAARRDLLYRLGRAERLVSSPGAAEPLQRAYELADSPYDRAEIALELGTALFYGRRVEEAVQVLEEAISGLDGQQVEFQRLLEAALLAVTSIVPPLYPTALNQIERIKKIGLADDVGSRMIDAVLAYDEARRLAPSKAVVERAKRALAAGPLYSGDNAAFIFAVYALTIADRFAEAEAVWRQAWADASERGSISGYAIVSTFRAIVELNTGRLDEALSDARNGLEASEEYGLVTAIPYAVAYTADALIELGDVTGARAALDRLDSIGDGSHLIWMFLASRARTRIALGETRAGLDDITHAARQFESMGGRNPSLLSWRSTAALAHFELGDREEAVRLAGDEVALAREWGQPRALGDALRVAGVVEPDQETGLALLKEAVAVLAHSPARLAHAKALVEFGAALDASGQSGDAQELLLAGLESARAIRAAPLVLRAERGLLSLGAKPPPAPTTGFAALTATERRTAAYAAEGLTIDEIAQTLFMTPAAVESTFARARQALGVETNDQLLRELSSSRRSDRSGKHSIPSRCRRRVRGR